MKSLVLDVQNILKVVESHNFLIDHLCLEINYLVVQNFMEVVESYTYYLINYLCLEIN